MELKDLLERIVVLFIHLTQLVGWSIHSKRYKLSTLVLSEMQATYAMAKRVFACRVQVTGRTTRICPKRRVSHASAGGEAGDFKKLFTIEERSGRGRRGGEVEGVLRTRSARQLDPCRGPTKWIQRVFQLSVPV